MQAHLHTLVRQAFCLCIYVLVLSGCVIEAPGVDDPPEPPPECNQAAVACTLDCGLGGQFATGPDGCPVCDCGGPTPCESDRDCGGAAKCVDQRCLREDPACENVACAVCLPGTLAMYRPGECCPECVPDCECDGLFDPVCGENGQTYGSPCAARCAGVNIERAGACGDDCPDPRAANVQYLSNSAEECREGIDFDCGAPWENFYCDNGCGCIRPATCECPDVLAPVCGVDGRDYANPCLAECEGVRVAHRGECNVEQECHERPNVCQDMCSWFANCAADQCPGISSNEDDVFGDLIAGQCLANCERDENLREELCSMESCDEAVDYAMTFNPLFESLCQFDHQCDDENRVYIAEDPESCAEIELFECPPNSVGFNDRCGCGCRLVGQAPCECPEIYRPVCGENGETYENACMADCARVDIQFEGECRAECPDVEAGAQYASEDPNECMIINFACPNDAEAFFSPECGCGCVPVEACACPRFGNPVCGVDGEDYENDCRADCAGVEIAYRGVCEEPACPAGDNFHYVSLEDEVCERIDFDCAPHMEYFAIEGCGCGCVEPVARPLPCACDDLYSPVCDVNGETYPNDCEAECSGAEIAYRGECNACPDPDDVGVSYISPDPEQCERIGFTCNRRSRPFDNECGCGCLPR